MVVQRVTRDCRVRALFAATLLLTLGVCEARAQSASTDDDPASDPPASAQLSSPTSTGWFSEPSLITRPMKLAVRAFNEDSDAKNSGFYPELSNMNTGAGWVSAGPGYRQYLLDDSLLLEGSAALSWHLYKMVQGRIELPALANERVIAGAQAMWQDQTQVDYFGIGPDSVEADQSQYGIKTFDVVGYGTWRVADWLDVNGELGWLRRPTLTSAGGTFVEDLPDTRELFADQPGASDPFQPNFLHSEVDVTADTRDYKGHPTRGGVYRAALIAYRDQGPGTFSFNEYEVGAAHFVPLAESRWVLAFRGWTVLTDVPAGHEVPFYLQPSLGGSNTLRDYQSFRFHDLNTLNVNAESRWALFDHVDVAAFFDAGNVAARAADLNLAKTSSGAGIRLHTDRSTFARLDIAYGAEGWRLVARTNDLFQMSRLSRRIARVPFAP